MIEFSLWKETSLCLSALMLKLAQLVGWEQAEKSPSLRQTVWNLPCGTDCPSTISKPRWPRQALRVRAVWVSGDQLQFWEILSLKDTWETWVGIQSSVKMVRNGTHLVAFAGSVQTEAFCSLRSQTPRVTDLYGSGFRKATYQVHWSP